MFWSFVLALGIKSTHSYLPIGDLFGDFFKVILSYPGATEISFNRSFGFFYTLTDWANNTYNYGINGLDTNTVTHFHMPPLSTVFSLTCLHLMHYIPAQIEFALVVLLAVFALYKISREIGSNNKETALWMGSILLSYPFIFAIQRGNMFYIASSIFLILYIVFIFKNKFKYLDVLLLALAVNIRPNAIIFIFALMIINDGQRAKRFVLFLFSSFAIFLISFYFANLMYPEYTFTNFTRGLGLYHHAYVAGSLGNPNNSSLFILIKLLLGYHRPEELLGVAIPGIIIFYAFWLFIKNKLNSIEYIFIICSCYMLSSTVFADYHLLVFLAPILILSIRDSNQALLPFTKNNIYQSASLIFITCCFLISPKNYLYLDRISVFELLNPIVALTACTFILYTSRKKTSNTTPIAS
jgi:hypothetical protein